MSEAVNGRELDEFKFLIINTPALWRKGIEVKNSNASENDGRLKFEEDGGISISSYKTFVHKENFRIPIQRPVDLALDRHCLIFYILESDSGRLLAYDLVTGQWEWISCLRFTNPVAIAVGAYDIYILDGNSLIVIAKTNYQLRQKFLNIGTSPKFIDIDSPEENIFIFDDKEKQVYKISKNRGIISALFNDGQGNDISNTSGFSLGKKDGKIYILESGGEKRIHIFSPGGIIEHVIDLAIPEEGFAPSGVAAGDSDSIFLGDRGGKPEYFPHPRKFTPSGLVGSLNYSRPSHKIIINDCADKLFVINLVDNWIIQFNMENRFFSSADYISGAVDSGINELRWHKFIADLELPDPKNNFVYVYYFASDTLSEGTLEDSYPSSDQWIVTPLPNPFDALMFEAKGRYLWFRIRLVSGDNKTSPKVRSIRAYLPRMSYVRYLPEIYQENESSKEFLDRYLSLFETFYTQIDENSVTRYIDPEGTPDGFLPWLASWLALGYDENWPKKNFRKLIEKAPQLFKMRGTRKGLEETLLTYLGHVEEMTNYTPSVTCTNLDTSTYSPTQNEQPYWFMIFENFQLQMVRGDPDYKSLFCDDPYSFCVLLNPQIVDEKKFKVIRHIIEKEKPAHTVANVLLLQPWFYLGMHTYLGINTELGDPQFTVGNSAIGRDTVLGTEDDSGQVEVRSRIGMDIRLS